MAFPIYVDFRFVTASRRSARGCSGYCYCDQALLHLVRGMASVNFLRARAVMDIFKDPRPATGETRLWVPRPGIDEVVRCIFEQIEWTELRERWGKVVACVCGERS